MTSLLKTVTPTQKLNVPEIPGLSFIDRCDCVSWQYQRSTEVLDTAGDICLRNFYAGSWHNGIQSPARRAR